jgi:hypothetical protein
MASRNPPPLLTERAALILLLAVLTGLGAGILTYLSGQNPPAAGLAGFGACGGALALFHTIIS